MNFLNNLNVKISKRLSRLELRLHHDELELIENESKVLNKTKSDFIRLAVSQYIQNSSNIKKPRIRESENNAKKILSPCRNEGDSEDGIAFQLAKIGNNLNQITRAIHIANKIGRPVDLVKTYLLVDNYLKKIYQLYPLPSPPSLHRSDTAVQSRHQYIEEKYLADLLRQMQINSSTELESVPDLELSDDNLDR